MDDIYTKAKLSLRPVTLWTKGAMLNLDKAIEIFHEDSWAKGIDAITYKMGNKVNIASYAEMAF